MRILLSLLTTLVLSCAAFAKPQVVTVWVGDSVVAEMNDRQALQETVTATSEDPKIAGADFKKSNNGTITITGVKEGTTRVVVQGDERVINAGIKKRDRDMPLTTGAFKYEIIVNVIQPEEVVRGLLVRVGQTADIKMEKGGRIVRNSVNSESPAIATAKARTGTALSISGVSPGDAFVTLKYTVKANKKDPERNVRATIKVRVWEKERGQKKTIRMGWDGLATKEIVILEDASYESTTEPISDDGAGTQDCCDNGSVDVIASVGFATMVGSDLVDGGLVTDIEGRSGFNDLPGDFFSGLPGADNLYALAGFSLYNFSSSDMFVDDVTGWSVRGGVGTDVCMAENTGPGGNWCWGIGGQAFVSFTSLTLNGSIDESDSSVGLGGSVGARANHASSGWGIEANAGGTVYATEMDFGVSGADGSRLSVFGNVGVSYSF